MNHFEAIGKANAFLLEHTGINAEPEAARLIQRPGDRRYWSVIYKAELFFQKDVENGAKIDGPYILRVDDGTGEVSVFG